MHDVQDASAYAARVQGKSLPRHRFFPRWGLAMTNDAAGYIEGEPVELKSTDDAMGVLMFGDSWPAMKAALQRAEAEPEVERTMRVVEVVEQRYRVDAPIEKTAPASARAVRRLQHKKTRRLR